MKKRTWAITVILIVTILLTILPGCNRVRQQIESMKPEIRETTLEWGSVTAETTEVLGTIRVYNPNPISLPVKKITYSITMAGINVGNGESPGFDIEAQAEFPIKVSTKVDNSRIPAFWVEHVKQSEKSEVSIDIKVTFDLKIADFTFPFNVKRTLETDYLASLNKMGPMPLEKKMNVPIIGEQTVFKGTLESLAGEWGDLTAETTEILLAARIRNENIYPLIAPRMEYKAETNGIILASGASELQFISPPNSTGDIDLSVKLDNALMDDWFVTHIRQGEKSNFNVNVSLVFDVPVYGEISIPIWESSQGLVTDILGSG